MEESSQVDSSALFTPTEDAVSTAFDRKQNGSKTRSGDRRDKKKFLPLPGIESQWSSRCPVLYVIDVLCFLFLKWSAETDCARLNCESFFFLVIQSMFILSIFFFPVSYVLFYKFCYFEICSTLVISSLLLRCEMAYPTVLLCSYHIFYHQLSLFLFSMIFCRKIMLV